MSTEDDIPDDDFAAVDETTSNFGAAFTRGNMLQMTPSKLTDLVAALLMKADDEDLEVD